MALISIQAGIPTKFCLEQKDLQGREKEFKGGRTIAKGALRQKLEGVSFLVARGLPMPCPLGLFGQPAPARLPLPLSSQHPVNQGDSAFPTFNPQHIPLLFLFTLIVASWGRREHRFPPHLFIFLPTFKSGNLSQNIEPK